MSQETPIPAVAPCGTFQTDPFFWNMAEQSLHLGNISTVNAYAISALFSHQNVAGYFYFPYHACLKHHETLPITLTYTPRDLVFPRTPPFIEKVMSQMWYSGSLGRLTLFYEDTAGEQYGAVYEYNEDSWHHAASFEHISWNQTAFLAAPLFPITDKLRKEP